MLCNKNSKIKYYYSIKYQIVMVRTIAFCNHKGGVGKTTSTASIGVAMARQGKKVLLVDLDGQANLTGICVSAVSGRKEHL